jgi:hypothetical protein
MAYINANASYGVRMRYSTISDYIAAVNAANITWPCYEYDFYPYAFAPKGPYSVPNPISSAHTYWTGIPFPNP